VGLDDPAERPAAHALAVREGAALAPGDDVLVRIRGLEQLGDEAALADAGYADEGHELSRLLRASVRESVGEQVALALAADERRPQLLLHVAAEARPGAERLPDLDRLGFPLRLDRRRLAVVDRLPRRADVLRIEVLRACGRADEVREEDRHHLPLLARGRGHGRERGSAHPTEAGAFGILLAARGADLHASYRKGLLAAREDAEPGQ